MFYGNLQHASGAVTHLGDNLTGADDGDDEQIVLDLSLMPANISRIAFTVTIYVGKPDGRILDKYPMPLFVSTTKTMEKN